MAATPVSPPQHAPLQRQMRHLAPPNRDGHHSTSHPRCRWTWPVPDAFTAVGHNKNGDGTLGIIGGSAGSVDGTPGSVDGTPDIVGGTPGIVESVAALASPRTVARTSVPPSVSSCNS